MEAALNGHHRIVSTLLEKGANPNITGYVSIIVNYTVKCIVVSRLCTAGQEAMLLLVCDELLWVVGSGYM